MAAPELGRQSRVTQARPFPPALSRPQTLQVARPGRPVPRRYEQSARKAGATEGYCLCRAIAVWVLDSTAGAGGDRLATRTPVGPLGMRSAPALVRRSPGFRRSSERRREVGPGRTRGPRFFPRTPGP